MPKNITYAFRNELVILPLDIIILSHPIDNKLEKSVKFQSVFLLFRKLVLLNLLLFILIMGNTYYLMTILESMR